MKLLPLAVIAAFFVLAVGSNAATQASTLYVATTGNDANACTQSAPCKTLNGAYQKAAPGDLVLVRSGSYPAQTIAEKASAAAPSVVIQPAPGESATFVEVNLRGRYVTVHGGDQLGVNEPDRFRFTTEATATMSGPTAAERFQTFEDVQAETLFIQGDRVTVRNSDLGPSNACDGSDDIVKVWWFITNQGDRGSRFVTIESNLIHDLSDSGCTSAHDDAIHVEMDDSVIRGNRIWHCGTQCLFQGYKGDRNLIENNMIEESSACPRCGVASEVGMGGSSTFRNNTVEGNVTWDGPSALEGMNTVTGNIFLSPHSCQDSATYSNNVFAASGGSVCGTNAKRGTPIMANGQPYSGDTDADWHLSSADTVAQGWANPANSAPIDFDGETRSSTPDAGADEVGGTQAPPPPPDPEPEPGDTVAPSVAWTMPTGGAVVSGTLSDSNCAALASDNVGIDHVDFLLDGTLLNTERTAPYTCGADTTAYPDGSHTLTARAFDAAGNQNSASIGVTFDNVEDPAPPPPPPPPAGCDAACEQAYKDQIAALQAQVATLTAERDAAVDRADLLQAKIDKALADLQP